MEKITGTQFEAIYNGKTLADFKTEQSSENTSTAPEQEENKDTAQVEETNE